MPTDPQRVKELFVAALELTDSPARRAFIDHECAGDAELRARLDDLLAANEEPDSAVERPFVLSMDSTSPRPGTRGADGGDGPGTIVAGKYKLLQRIGQGGMGSVWMADQLEPVKRRVAVKLIRVDHQGCGNVLSRFEAERQAIALMDHPNIAKLLDAGETPPADAGGSPRPFFVMDLVKGVPVTEFCDEHRLSIPERLKLFAEICAAVQHAHQKGIIHRDLNPTNILVEMHDDRPVPKVIDFGLAKALSGQPLTENTLFTGFGVVTGTPLYMAPEQAKFNAIDVDTRADVYALGVILYELLTGSTPLERAALKTAALDELLRVIRETEPQVPSKRVTSVGVKPSIAANRQTESFRLGRFLSGELDWIVMKALAKERDRRYESASHFARDVDRFLNHEPVSAGPPSALYRTQKFVRKNRAAVFTAAAFAALLLLGAGLSIWQAVRATRAEAIAVEAREEAVGNMRRAVAAEKSATKQQQRAEEEAAVSRAVSEFLRFTVLAQADPRSNSGPDKTVTLRSVLDRASELIASGFPDQPRVEAEIRRAIGDAYYGLGEYDLAQPHLEAAVRIHQTKLGEPDPLPYQYDLALLYKDQNQLGKAEALFGKVVRRSRKMLGEDHQLTLLALNGQGGVYFMLGRFEDAERVYAEALTLSEKRFGQRHALTYSAEGNLALAYKSLGKYSDAERIYLKHLAIERRSGHENHPHALVVMHNLAALYAAQGSFEKAEPLFQQVLAARRQKIGRTHPHTIMTQNALADLYEKTHEPPKAEQLYRATVDEARAKLGADHLDIRNACSQLGWVCEAQGKLTEAETAFRQLLEGALRLGPQNPDYHGALAQLGRNLLLQKKFNEAEPLLRESLSVRERFSPEDWKTFNGKSLLGGCLLGQKRFADAEPLLLAGYDGMKQREMQIPADGYVRLPEAAERLVQLYEVWGKPEEATKWRATLAQDKK
jgi:serine/threonine protein kinase/Flp pilus assembly protein TadD